MSSFQKGDAIQQSRIKRAKFPLPELGQDKFILLRAMSAQEVKDRNAKEKAIRTSIEAEHPEASKDEVDATVSEHPDMSVNAIIALCATNDDGSPIFTDATDVEANLPIEFASWLGMVKKVFELSGLSNIKDRSKN